MKRGSATLIAALAAALVTGPAAAQAATLEVRPAKACFGSSDKVSLVGSGFTPRKSVNIFRDGRILNRSRGKIEPIDTDAMGRIAVVATVPDLKRAVQSSTYSARDTSDSSLRASVDVRLSDLRVSIRPDDAVADRPRRIFGRGFTARGRTLWAHVVRKKFRRTFRVGKLKGRCRTAAGTRRLFGRNAVRGTYRVQFDAFKRYRPSRRQRIRFSVAIKPVTGSAAAGVASIERVRGALR